MNSHLFIPRCLFQYLVQVLLDGNLMPQAVKHLSADPNRIAISPVRSRPFYALGMLPGVALALWSNSGVIVSICNARLIDLKKLAFASNHDLFTMVLADLEGTPHFVRVGAGNIILFAFDRDNDGFVKMIASRTVALGFHPAQVVAFTMRNAHAVESIHLLCWANDAHVIYSALPRCTISQLVTDEIKHWTRQLIAPLTDRPGLAILACDDRFSISELSVDCLSAELGAPSVGKPHIPVALVNIVILRKSL